jgi:hypothetical protein
VPATVNAGAPTIGPIAEVVVATNRLDADVSFCTGILGWRAGPQQLVDEAMAARWRSSAARGLATVAVRPPDGAPGAGVRFVATAAVPPPPFEPMTTHGWAAIEVVVTDVDALARACDGAAVASLGLPASVGAPDREQTGDGAAAGAVGGLRAMQILLPGGAPAYLTEIRRSPPGFRLPQLGRGVGGVFIVVAASPDLDRTREFLESRFALPRVTDHHLAVGVLNRAFRLPPSTRHRISSLQLAGAAAIEIDQYPPQAQPRPCTDDQLPHGIAVVEFHTADRSRTEPGALEGPFGLRLGVVP